MMMSRVRAIWVALMPALLLVATVNCIGDPITGCSSDPRDSLLRANGDAKDGDSPANDCFDQAIQRWSRRLNLQPNADGFDPTATLAQERFSLPDATPDSAKPAST